MNHCFMRFPGGKVKALTLSYDDNVKEDVRLVQIMKKYGLKGTFNINSIWLMPHENVQSRRRMDLEQTLALHASSGMEVACHGLNHVSLDQLSAQECLREVYDDRVNLEKIFGRIVRGMAYPNGTFSDSAVDVLKLCGIAYCRTIVSTERFNIPSDWLRLPATCHHDNPRLMELAQRFVENRQNRQPLLFYLWGHSYEFDDNDNWHVIEKFSQYMGGREDIWYATNIEIFDYVNAYRQLVFSADGKTVYNPTNTCLFLETQQGAFAVKPGQTREI